MRDIFVKRNDNQIKLSIDQIIGSSYIRYDRLSEIIKSAFVGSDAETINLFIDMYSILKPLYKNQVYDIEDYTKVTSNIINICAHYRDFFKTRYGVYTNIYLINSNNTNPLNKKLYCGYNESNENNLNNHMIKDMINNNINLLNILCPYLPDIHFINSQYETGVVIYDIISRLELENNHPNIILTKDIYNYQLAGICKDVTILRPKKSKGNDESYYANKFNLVSIYLKERKVKNEHLYSSIRPEMLSLVMCMSSVKERSIKNLCNINITLKHIISAITEFRISNGYNSFNILENAFDFNKLKTSSIVFTNRFKSIDIPFQHSIYMDTPECKSISFHNLIDSETVREINNKYFTRNPLDLDRL